MGKKQATMGLCLSICALVYAPLLAGQLIFNDGLTHNIDYAINNQVVIENESFWNYPTTVNLLEGGSLSVPPEIQGFVVTEDSNLNIFGGIVNGSINANDNAKVDIASGNFTLAHIHTYNAADIEISGGVFNDFYGSFSGSGQVYISGGIFHTTPNYSFVSKDQTNVSIVGGTFFSDNNFRVAVQNYSSMTIAGGIGFINHLSLSDNSHTTIQGYDIKINGLYVPSGSYAGTRQGFMTGFLLDDTAFEYNLTINNDAILTVQNIPEPASLLLFVLGGLSLRFKHSR